jgi:hypothetical protein
MKENIKDNDVQVLQAQYEERIKELRLGFAIEIALLRAGARNVKATAALLDRDKLSVDKDGKVEGLEEQINELKENEETAFLFESAVRVKGLIPYESGNVPTEKMTYSHFCEIYGKH